MILFFFEQSQKALRNSHEITDAQLKHHTISLEIRSPRFPHRLKIEIHRELRNWEHEEAITFSRYGITGSGKGTLPQAMQNKFEALSNCRVVHEAEWGKYSIRNGFSLLREKLAMLA